jgi:hypothetical protein
VTCARHGIGGSCGTCLLLDLIDRLSPPAVSRPVGGVLNP